MEELEKEEREALCPECSAAFKVFVDRLVPRESGLMKNDTVSCPICGCGKCTIHK